VPRRRERSNSFFVIFVLFVVNSNSLSRTEILFQIAHTHLDRRNTMLVEQIEECATIQAEHFRRLSLRKTAFFKPTQHSRSKSLARSGAVKAFDELRWEFNRDLAHGRQS
jgi:hypothetical protein